MKALRACITLVSLGAFLSPGASAQRAQAAAAPASSTGPGFVAARYLAELESTPVNAGVFVTGDLDNDGDVDFLACARPSLAFEPTGIQSWLNGGRGDFQLAHSFTFAPWSFSSYFSIAQQAYVADITGDGVLDLAYDRRDSFGTIPSGILVHPGLGDGSFGHGLLLATDGPPQEFLVGDCDGDGDSDLLVHGSNTGSGYQNTLAWWRLENGTFVSGAPLLVDAERPLRLVAMDAEGDGITDAVSGTFAGYDALQFFRTVNGAPTLFATVPLPSEVRDINQRQRTGDIDGDGREDVLLDLENVTTHLFYVQAVLGTGSGYQLAPLQVFENHFFERPYSRDGLLADWDADGDLDFVSPTFSWLENTGGASFEPAGQQYSSWNGNGNRTPMHVADVDGDGHLDAFAQRMLFRGDGAFPRRTSLAGYTEYVPSSWTRVEDWDGDGDLDLTSAYQLELNNGDGTLVSRSTAISIPNAFSVNLVAQGDFDGDGLRDALVSSFRYPPLTFERMTLMRGTENGPYVTSATVPSAVELPAGSSSGDLDGDGDVDVLATDGYWANDGTGRFGSAPVNAYLGVPLLVLDGDGDLDLDLLVRQGGRLKWLQNLGALAFASTDLGPDESGVQPALLDADEDGDLDFVAARPASGTVEVRERLAGGFAGTQVLSAPGVSGPPGLTDVDGDGRLDLVVPRGQLIAAWPRGAGLGFGARREWVSRDAPRAYGDLDGDGDVDVLGMRHFRNLCFDGPADGFALQYGLDAATSGTGGRHPLLGARGPKRPGQPAELVIARGRGQAPGVLLLGKSRADVLDGGYRRLVDQSHVARSFVLDGPAGVAGAGTLVVPLRVRAALIGRTFDFQAVLFDPGASANLSASNGLEIRFGGWPRD